MYADEHDVDDDASVGTSAELLEALGDDELEAELTIAVARAASAARFDALLAERERRRSRFE